MYLSNYLSAVEKCTEDCTQQQELIPIDIMEREGQECYSLRRIANVDNVYCSWTTDNDDLSLLAESQSDSHALEEAVYFCGDLF